MHTTLRGTNGPRVRFPTPVHSPGRGQDVVESGLLIATIAIVVLVGISFVGTNISAWFTSLANRITTNT